MGANVTQNTFKELENFETSEDWIRGRIHLCDITKKYKSKLDLSFDEAESIDFDEKPTTDHRTDNKSKTKMKKTKAFDQRDHRSIIIGAESLITRCGFDQNYISAIAAVDYAMRDTKPTCALV